MVKRIIAFVLIFSFFSEQSGFAQVADIVDLSASFSGFATMDRSRPMQARSLIYDRAANELKLFIDKGDRRNPQQPQAQKTAAALMEYFQVGITLPDSAFWVNLRPDGEGEIIDPLLEKTDLGRIFLETDLALKKDLAGAISPATADGRKYWNKLYARAEALFGTREVVIPTLTRPWIVPGEIIVRQSAESVYVYKAILNVKLEQDHLQNSKEYTFDDQRMRELNEYSTQLARELVLPGLTRKVNSSKTYAAFRQVFYSLILAKWYKQNFKGTSAEYAERIETRNLSGLSSKAPWSKESYFEAYRTSFSEGEYNSRENVSTAKGTVIRNCTSGGISPEIMSGVDFKRIDGGRVFSINGDSSPALDGGMMFRKGTLTGIDRSPTDTMGIPGGNKDGGSNQTLNALVNARFRITLLAAGIPATDINALLEYFSRAETLDAGHMRQVAYKALTVAKMAGFSSKACSAIVRNLVALSVDEQPGQYNIKDRERFIDEIDFLKYKMKHAGIPVNGKRGVIGVSEIIRDLSARNERNELAEIFKLAIPKLSKEAIVKQEMAKVLFAMTFSSRFFNTIALYNPKLVLDIIEMPLCLMVADRVAKEADRLNCDIQATIGAVSCLPLWLRADNFIVDNLSHGRAAEEFARQIPPGKYFRTKNNGNEEFFRPLAEKAIKTAKKALEQQDDGGQLKKSGNDQDRGIETSPVYKRDGGAEKFIVPYALCAVFQVATVGVFLTGVSISFTMPTLWAALPYIVGTILISGFISLIGGIFWEIGDDERYSYYRPQEIAAREVRQRHIPSGKIPGFEIPYGLKDLDKYDEYSDGRTERRKVPLWVEAAQNAAVEAGEIPAHVDAPTIQEARARAGKNDPGRDGGKTPVGGIDIRGMQVKTETSADGVFSGPVSTVPLKQLTADWQEIKLDMVKGGIPYLKMKQCVAGCVGRQDATGQLKEISSCIKNILKEQEARAVETEEELKQILVQLG